MKTKLTILPVLLIALATSCKKSEQQSTSASDHPVVNSSQVLADPPATWQEHWFEHVQLLKRVYSDTSVAVYYDDDVSRTITWPNTYLAQVWNYTKQKYGSFGTDPRLFVILSCPYIAIQVID